MRKSVRVWMRRLLVLGLSLCLLFGVVPSASAQPLDVFSEVMTLAKQVGPFMERRPDGTYELKATAAAFKVSQEAFDRYTHALNAINVGIRQGSLSADSLGHLRTVQHAGVAGAIHPADVCSTYSTIRMSEQQTKNVEIALTMAAGASLAVSLVAAAIACLVPPAVPVGAVLSLATGLVSLGLGTFVTIMTIVDNGQGDTIHWETCFGFVPWAYPTGN